MNADKERLPNNKLLYARLERHWSQRELAARLGTTFVNVSRWERGVTTPGVYYRRLLCQLFDKPCAELGLLVENTDQGATSVESSTAEVAGVLPLWHLPYQRNPFFSGREQVLLQLHAWLNPQQPTTSCHSSALSGMSGIGKTQTALEYAYRYASAYTALFWVDAETPERLMTSFLALAQTLRLAERHEREQRRVVTAVLSWLYAHDRWLLIFDNVENIELVRGFLPPARHGSLLFTTRQQTLDLSAHLLHLKTLTFEEGWQFFLRRTRWLDLADALPSPQLPDENAARALVAAMDGLPLALDQAASYIEATRCRPAEYLQLFRSSPLTLLDEREPYAEHPFSVARTFTLSLHFLEQSCPEANEILTVCAYLAPEALPEVFFSKGAPCLGPTFEALAANPLRFHQAIKALLACSLLQRNPQTGSVIVHRLVQTVLKASQPATLQRAWATRVLRAMSKVFPTPDETRAEDQQLGAQLLPHALACLPFWEQWEANAEEHVPWICAVAASLTKYARYDEAKQLYQRVLQHAERGVDAVQPWLAYPLYGLASVALEQGNYAEAEARFQQALHLCEHAPEAQETLASTLSGLALLSWRQGKYEQAEPLYLRVVHLRERLLGAEHPAVALPLTGLAALYWQQGKYEQVEPLYLRALQILVVEHPESVHALHGLADLYRQQGKYEQAEPLFRRALQLQQKLLGSEHPHVARLFMNLAMLYADQGRSAEAERFYRQALHIQERSLGSEHPDSGQVLHGLADLARQQKRSEEAERLYRQALHVLEHALGQEHPLLAYPLDHLALLYVERARYAEARPLFERACHIRLASLGAQHPETVEVFQHLALLQEAQARQGEAQPLVDSTSM